MMLNNLVFSVLAAGLLQFVSVFVYAEDIISSSTPPAATVAAGKSLNVFQQLNGKTVNEANVSVDGAPGQPPDTVITAPFKDYYVSLDALNSWNGADPSSVLQSSGRIVFPIVTNNNVQSSVTVAKKGEDWTAVAFGSATESKLKTEIRSALTASAPAGSQPELAQVRVPALNQVFLAGKQGDTLMFTPITSSAKLGTTVGQPEPAKDILLRLKAAGVTLDSSVPN